MPNELIQTLPQAIEQAFKTLRKFSIPLYVNDESGRPSQFGTCFIVKAGKAHFLVSAAHVLDVVLNKDVFFYTATKKLRRLDGRVVTTGHHGSRDDDMLDIGVMRLDGALLPPYPEVDKFAMDISYLKPNYLPRTGKHYVIIGFPSTKSRADVATRTAISTSYIYGSDSSDEKEYVDQGVSVESHVVLPFDVKKTLGKDRRVRPFPKPHGMSGSPIFVLYDVRERPGHSRAFPVVAVGTHYRKASKVLIGTDVRFVVGAIERSLCG